MGLRRNIPNGRPVVEHSSSRPRVYLDTWAIDAISNHHRDRFIKTLNGKNGTLCLSLFNAIELINYKNLAKRNMLLSLIDEVDSVFIDVDPLNVAKTKTFYDMGLGAEYEPKINPLEIFRVTSVIKQMANDIEQLGLKKIHDFETSLWPQLQEFRKDKNKMEIAKRRREKKRYDVKVDDPAVKVRAVFYACADFIVLNKDMKMGNSEWWDTLHVIVPSACCDFVLIDSRWMQFLTDAGLTYPDVAKTFSPRGVEEFLLELEKFEAKK